MSLPAKNTVKTIPVRDLVAQARECPHCHVRVMGTGKSILVGRSVVEAWSCNHCWKDTIRIAEVTSNVNSLELLTGAPTTLAPVQVIPSRTAASRDFPNAPDDVMEAYKAATDIAPIYGPAAAAMARKAIERLLDHRGYKHRQLAEKLQALTDETRPEKRVSLRLLGLAAALREFGNIGLHTVRSTSSDEIVQVEPGEVEICISTAEEMIEELCERPVWERAKTTSMVAKLRDAGKKGAADILEASFARDLQNETRAATPKDDGLDNGA